MSQSSSRPSLETQSGEEDHLFLLPHEKASLDSEDGISSPQTEFGWYGVRTEPSAAPFSRKYIEYDLQLGQKSSFTTFDREVADEAWASISMKQGYRGFDFQVGWLKVAQDKVDEMDQPSVEFHDKSGYFFGMDVFHQLHCLNYLRKKSVLYSHLYPAGSEIEDEQVPPEFHIPHCIDSIRLSLQCHADLTFVPERWVDGWLEPWAVWKNKHMCRDFDAVHDWALENAPDTAGKLYHPQLGKVVSGRLNLTALPIWQEAYDTDVVLGKMPVCHKH
ncbi:Uu.00g134790.m01.CDS01 [Anthostomella pinea]|uniref:Uu.00g134790.m01.CDS01 n=1 Tax=Anthostomella pinea TaxID=933095 RepID=A0AAI8VPN4_9PEZI|nr:Uu.00g134790.m01.CDS01 [Anthostomella pinea]